MLSTVGFRAGTTTCSRSSVAYRRTPRTPRTGVVDHVHYTLPPVPFGPLSVLPRRPVPAVLSDIARNPPRTRRPTPAPPRYTGRTPNAPYRPFPAVPGVDPAEPRTGPRVGLGNR